MNGAGACRNSGERKNAQYVYGSTEVGLGETGSQRPHQPGSRDDDGGGDGGKDPGEQTIKLEQQGGARRALAGRQHGDERENHAVDQQGIQRVQRTHSHSQGIGAAVRP